MRVPLLTIFARGGWFKVVCTNKEPLAADPAAWQESPLQLERIALAYPYP
jgi:hypothetical protein